MEVVSTATVESKLHKIFNLFSCEHKKKQDFWGQTFIPHIYLHIFKEFSEETNSRQFRKYHNSAPQSVAPQRTDSTNIHTPATV